MGVCPLERLIEILEQRFTRIAPTLGIQGEANDAAVSQIKADADVFTIRGTGATPRGNFKISGKTVEAFHLGGLLGLEVIEQALHGVHAGFFDRALGDLADRRKRHAGFTRDGALRDLLFSKLRHDHLVKIDWVFHGYES